MNPTSLAVGKSALYCLLPFRSFQAAEALLLSMMEGWRKHEAVVQFEAFNEFQKEDYSIYS